MTKRYFKFTDGTRTVFRGTGMVRGFAYGWIAAHMRQCGVGWVGFSNSPVNAKATTFPATEITKTEFDALVALKKARVIAAGRSNLQDSGPQDAWVHNAQLVETSHV